VVTYEIVPFDLQYELGCAEWPRATHPTGRKNFRKINNSFKYFHQNDHDTGISARIEKRISDLDFPAHFTLNWDMMSKILVPMIN
jgi:hypothetical protein